MSVLDPELLRLDFLGFTARHDPVELPREDLALFFAEISDRYGLSRFEYAPGDGATFSGLNGTEFVLRPVRTASCGVTVLGYREGAERVFGLLGESVGRYGMRPLWIEDVTLIATWDAGDPEAARAILADGVLGIDEERRRLLGGDDVEMGLRLWRSLGDGSIDCAIEPMHSDPGKLYLRLVGTCEDPVADVAALTDAADAVHRFLYGPLVEFVQARAPR